MRNVLDNRCAVIVLASGTRIAYSDRSDGRGAMGDACVYTVGCVGDCGSEGTSFALSERSAGAVRVLGNMETVTAIVPAVKLIILEKKCDE